MKRTPVLITLGITLCLVAGYFVYEKVLSKDKLKPWDLVPADAIVVYEKNNCNSCVDVLGESTLWKVIEQAAFYKKPVDSIRSKISRSLKDQSGFLISAHVTKKDDFDFIYYVPSNRDVVGSTLVGTASKYKLTSREFNSVQIQELRFANQLFSYALIEDVWIGSFTPFLIEDVIRTFKSSSTSFKKNAINPQAFSSIQDDAGNLHLQLKNFSDLLSVFIADPSFFRNYTLGKSSVLDIKPGDNNLVLNGFSSDSTDFSNYLLSTFHHQSPVSFGLKQLISNRALAVSSYGVSDGEEFSKDLQAFVKKRNPLLRDTLTKLSNSNNFELEKLYSLIADEFGVCFFESSKSKSLSKVLLIESTQPEKWFKILDKVSAKLSIDTIFYERYAQYEIREVPVFKFPEKLLWPFVTGFEQTFYTSIGNVIIMADNLEELKFFLDDIEDEDVWGKSVAQNRFLESTLLESNFSVYINPSKAWNLFSHSLQPRWQGFVKENQGLLKSLQMTSIQFSHLNNNYYTNTLFTYKPYVSTHQTKKSDESTTTNFEHGVQTIFAVKSHVNRSNEVLIQDSLNDLSLISSEGKVLWKLSIGDRIIGDVSQVDFFGNGKLQYLFATTHAIHIIDRLGNYVDPYPLRLPSIEIEFLSVVDYDNSKKYRFLVSDKNGQIWMYDKEGRSLEGWQPKNIEGSLAMGPRHHRIKGKDYILAVRKDGQVYLMNRRGENLRKFPMDSESFPVGDFFLETGSTLANTYFVLASRDGFKIKFNPEGRIQSKEALLKTSVGSVFSLINEKSLKSYLILQQDARQMNLTDPSGKKIISADVTGLTPSDIEYYDFGAGKIFIAVRDRLQGFSYLYDGDGNLLTSPPLETTAIEIRPYGADQFKAVFVNGKSLITQPLN